jgi:thiol-disulfide isomerase/thioredoxin
LKALKSPRLWLMVWGALGALAILYVIIAASVQFGDGAGRGAPRDASLLTGAMAKFEYAFPPRPAPLAPFDSQAGEITLEAFRGRVVLVNFWATWCAPCLKELPSLDRLQALLGGEQFEVVAIAADPRGRAAAAQFLERLEARNLALYSDERLRLAASIGGGAALPVTILYDRAGREVGRLTGEADWASPEAVRLVESVIARP